MAAAGKLVTVAGFQMDVREQLEPVPTQGRTPVPAQMREKLPVFILPVAGLAVCLHLGEVFEPDVDSEYPLYLVRLIPDGR